MSYTNINHLPNIKLELPKQDFVSFRHKDSILPIFDIFVFYNKNGGVNNESWRVYEEGERNNSEASRTNVRTDGKSDDNISLSSNQRQDQEINPDILFQSANTAEANKRGCLIDEVLKANDIKFEDENVQKYGQKSQALED